MSKPTPPQERALRLMLIGYDGHASSVGALPVERIPGRMVDSYRVANSLIDKGLATNMNGFLYITDAGRKAVINARSASEWLRNLSREQIARVMDCIPSVMWPVDLWCRTEIYVRRVA